MTLGDEIKELAVESLRDPRRAAARLLSREMPPAAPWLALVLVAILWVILDQLVGGDQGAAMSGLPGAELMDRPVTAVPVNILSTVMLALSVQLCGRMFGHKPAFGQALTLVLWLQFLLLLSMIATILVTVLIPPLGALLGLAALGLYLWLIVCFSAVLNRMDSLVFTVLGLVLAALIVSFAIGIVLTFLLATGLISIPGVA